MAKQKNQKDGSSHGLLVTGLAVAGVVAGYFLYGPKGSENRQKVKAWSLKAKAEVLEGLEKASVMSEDRYNQLVDKVTNKYSRLRNVSEEEALKLNKEMKKYWQTIKKDIASRETKAKKQIAKTKQAATKSAANAKKKVKQTLKKVEKSI